MEYKFDHIPTAKEIKKTTEYHLSHYTDYCKVWYDDGSKEIFKNDIPVCNYNGDNYFITFEAREIRTDGSFGQMGIIRAKRYIRQISKKVDKSLNP